MAAKGVLPLGPSLFHILSRADKAFLNEEKKVKHRQQTYYDLRGSGLQRDDAVKAARLLLDPKKGSTDMQRHDAFIRFLKQKGYTPRQVPSEKQ